MQPERIEESPHTSASLANDSTTKLSPLLLPDDLSQLQRHKFFIPSTDSGSFLSDDGDAYIESFPTASYPHVYHPQYSLNNIQSNSSSKINYNNHGRRSQGEYDNQSVYSAQKRANQMQHQTNPHNEQQYWLTQQKQLQQNQQHQQHQEHQYQQQHIPFPLTNSSQICGNDLPSSFYPHHIGYNNSNEFVDDSFQHYHHLESPRNSRAVPPFSSANQHQQLQSSAMYQNKHERHAYSHQQQHRLQPFQHQNEDSYKRQKNAEIFEQWNSNSNSSYRSNSIHAGIYRDHPKLNQLHQRKQQYLNSQPAEEHHQDNHKSSSSSPSPPLINASEESQSHTTFDQERNREPQVPTAITHQNVSQNPSRVLLAIVFDLPENEITNDHIYRIFLNYGFVNKVLIFKREQFQTKAFIEMESLEIATLAKNNLAKVKIPILPNVTKPYKLMVHYSETPTLDLCNYKTEGRDYREHHSQASISTLSSSTVSIVQHQQQLPPQKHHQSLRDFNFAPKEIKKKSHYTETLIATQQSLISNDHSSSIFNDKVNQGLQSNHSISMKSSSSIEDDTTNLGKPSEQQQQLQQFPCVTDRLSSSSAFLDSIQQAPTQSQSERLIASPSYNFHQESYLSQSEIRHPSIQFRSQQRLNSPLSLNTHPTSESFESPVIYVKNMVGQTETSEISPENVYNVFRNFGFVQSVLFLKEKSAVMVQYEEIDQARMAINQLNNSPFGLSQDPLRISFAKRIAITVPESALRSSPAAASGYYFVNKNNDPKCKVISNCSSSNMQANLQRKSQFYNPASRTIYVANIPMALADKHSELLSIFVKFGGSVTNYKIQKNDMKVSAFVELDSIQTALRVIGHLHNTLFYGKMLQIFFTRTTLTKY